MPDLVEDLRKAAIKTWGDEGQNGQMIVLLRTDVELIEALDIVLSDFKSHGLHGISFWYWYDEGPPKKKSWRHRYVEWLTGFEF